MKAKLQLKKKFWEDSKNWSFLIFFLLAKFINILIVSTENFNLVMMFLHLKTMFCVPLMFLFKKKWVPLVVYFVFQMLGSVFMEVGLTFNYFFSNFIMGMGIFLKLGNLPLFWWFPSFLKKKKWLKFFFFKTFNKFPLIYLWSFLGSNFFEKSMIVLSVLGSMMGVWFSSSKSIINKLKMKYFLGWMSIMDTKFMCWLSLKDLEMFSFVFIYYLFVYLFMSMTFFFYFKNKSIFIQKMNKKKAFFFFFKSLVILFLLGFPPLFPFLFKFQLMMKFFLKKKIFYMIFFFFSAIIQALCYLKIFLKIFSKKKDFLKFKTLKTVMIFFSMFFFFFFFFFFW